MGKAARKAYTFAMEDLFLDYAQGYVDQDMNRIAQNFAYPCMLTNESGTDLICDAEDLEQHFTGFLAHLTDNNLAEAVPTILSDQRHGDDNRVVSVKWQLRNVDGQVFSQIQFLYVLVRSGSDWKISLANVI